jgi:hypothetical protein
VAYLTSSEIGKYQSMSDKSQMPEKSGGRFDDEIRLDDDIRVMSREELGVESMKAVQRAAVNGVSDIAKGLIKELISAVANESSKKLDIQRILQRVRNEEHRVLNEEGKPQPPC